MSTLIQLVSRKLAGDSVNRRFVRGSAGVLLVSALGQVFSFGLQVQFARQLGSVEYGIYSYVFGWLSIGLILGKFGYDFALVRFVAAYTAKERPGRVRGVIETAMRRGSLLALVFAAPICFGAWYFASGPRASLVGAVLLLAVMMPAATYTELVAAAVRGFGKGAASLVGEMLIRPIVAAALMGAFVAVRSPISSWHAISAYLAGTIGASLFSTHLLRKTIPAETASAPARLKRSWSRFAALMMVANGFLTILYSLDVLMLGALHSTTSSGHYSVATRLAILVLFVMNAAQVVAGPMLATAHARGRPTELRRVVRMFNLFSVLAAVPVACLIGLLSPWLLAAFGPEFEPAGYPLLVLLGMQAFNAITGPVGLLLGMTGRQKDLVALLGGAVVINAALNWWLIPAHGAMGAAWASFIAHGAWNIVGVVRIRRTLRIDCSIADWLRAPSIVGA